MRGSPLIRALLAFIGILLIGIPLYRLTNVEAHVASSQSATPAPEPVQARKAIRLQVTFTAVPRSIKVLYLGEEIWAVTSPAAEMQKKVAIDFPREGVDLQFEIEWPNEGFAAMRAVLTDSDDEPHERSVFGKGGISEVLTFQ